MFDNGKGHITVTDLQSILYSSFSMNPEDVEILFRKIDQKNDGLITYGKYFISGNPMKLSNFNIFFTPFHI